MLSSKSRLAVALAASLMLAGSVAPSAFAQNADQIRGKCIDQVVQQYPDPDPSFQRVRVQLYINCMKDHGLTP